ETSDRFDDVAVEEPLEIRVRTGSSSDGDARSLAITMRTPGNDFELAAGFLHAEGLLADRTCLSSIKYCMDRDVDGEQLYNIVTVDLTAAGDADAHIHRLERHFVTTSACGVCGRASLDALSERGLAPVRSELTVSRTVLSRLPDDLRSAQRVFAGTGGLHAAGLFDGNGGLLCAREDVGRHNAVDKVVGWALLEDRLPLAESVLLVSGRASYEILQKALAAGMPVVAAVSAPSSLAVDVATRYGLTLVGFLRGGRFNVYAGGSRIVG
ncbi:MAG TPA: formate dehydrogenase accessory sulfurtransferase FdhD, partial [Acidimicrobiales bacterium]|nr:formate dehydrogenase accessory sulfurtransferase FdhD [Acidimicrobiales bacterium]